MKNTPLKISRILHAGYLLQSDSAKILFDPIFENPFSTNCYAFPKVTFKPEVIRQQKFSAVFISHFHDDHFSLESLNLIERDTPVYFYCLHEEAFTVLKELGFTRVFALKLNHAICVGDFKVTPRRALESHVDCLLQIEVFTLNILNVVDSWIDDDTLFLLSQQKPWDLVLWPLQTMRELDAIAPRGAFAPAHSLPPEWLAQIRKLNPRIIVPSSCQFKFEEWSWFNHYYFPITHRQFFKEIRAEFPDIQVIEMSPLTTVLLNGSEVTFGPKLDWGQAEALAKDDYEFVSDLVPPTTQSVAEHLPVLNSEQLNIVKNSCAQELIERWLGLESVEDDYMQRPIGWKLRLFLGGKNSTPLEFNYFISEGRITCTESIAVDQITWLTEIPAVKLFNALFLGESLNSIYIRINDMQFSEELEPLVRAADPFADPLLRVLYSRSLIPYQWAQLKKTQIKF